MKRSEFVASLMLGVAVASIVDGFRVSVGLEFWHLLRASQDVQDVFFTRFVLDLVVLSVACVAGPGIVSLLLIGGISRDDGATTVSSPRERLLERSREARQRRLRAMKRGN